MAIDSVAANYCAITTAYSSPGDLVAKADADGNHICYYYDSLHRLTDVGNNHQSTTNACERFRYDSTANGYVSQPPGAIFANTTGRMIEAETDSGSTITDEWFSYDKDGNVTDIWEMTPHSGTYYHSFSTFAGNGVPLSVQLANPSLYTMTYGLDGEGRPSTLKEGTETIVAGTTFNSSGQPTYIDLGTGTDQSDYIYDPSTGRMTNWTFQVGSASETGALGWNANGTLKTLAINDGFNAGGTQSCNINPSLATGTGYDDLGRLVGIDCGSGGWGQNFSYDQYDNLTKSVISGRTGIAWNPGYNPANNHYSSGASYDNSGNLTNDSIHLYTWDQFNKLSSIDSSACATNGECVTYDALGRAVETSYDGAYTEIWYTQLGKAVYMQGSTPYYAYFPTPGGGTVEVNGNAATNYYMHKDWLGNSRISSTVVSHTVISDQAYAPFGEVYDKLATGASTPGQMFTGDVQNIISGIFDTPNRELNASQGRWLSPDPALAGWNQYAYVNNNPLSLSVDPTGLACWPFEKGRFGNCMAFMNNGVDFGGNWNEFYVMQIRLVTVSSVYTPPSLVTPPTLWDSEGNEVPDPLYTLFQTTGGWSTSTTQVGTGFDILSNSGSAANNGSWWGTFFSTLGNGLLHGVRQPGQSVTECVNQNVSNTTFGTVDPQKLFNQGLNIAEETAALLTATNLKTAVGPSVPLGPYVAGQLARMAGLGSTGTAVAIRAAAATGTTLAVAGAATAGAAIGSAINCR